MPATNAKLTNVAWVALLLLVSLLTNCATVLAAEFNETFGNFNNWTVHRAQSNRDQFFDFSFGMPAPSLRLPPAASPDPPGFGDDVNSIYLSNPLTSQLSDFSIDFWIYFDSDVGRVVMAFRMQDDRNYYGILMADTHDWDSSIVKFSNDKIIVLATKGPGLFASGIWYHVKVVVQGSSFFMYKDDELQLTAEDNEWSAGNAFGIGFYNEFNDFDVHIDSLTLSTLEPLHFVSLLVQTSVTTSTSTTQAFVTSTSFSILADTSTTRTTQSATMTVTSSNTTYIGVLLPATEFSLFETLVISVVGFFVGLLYDEKKVRRAVYFAAVIVGTIASIYLISLGPRSLVYLWPLWLSIVAGACCRMVYKSKHGLEADNGR